jgi:biopolymer transport protein ExbB/TolQ
MMTAALDPAITPLLAYAVIACLVVISFVTATAVIMLKVRKWLKELFAEFSHSDAFRRTVKAIMDEAVQRIEERLEARIERLERYDQERAKTQKALHERADDLMAKFAELQRWVAEKLFQLSERLGERPK